MKKKESLMVKTTDGLLIHLSIVEALSVSAFADEDGTVLTLKGITPAFPLHLKVEDGSYCADMSDGYNQAAQGIDSQSYYRSGEPTNEDKTERRIVEKWANIKYPDFRKYEYKEARKR